MEEAEDTGRATQERQVHFAMPLDEVDEILLHLAGVIARGEGSRTLHAAGARVMLVAKQAGHDCPGIAAMRSALSAPAPSTA